MIAFVQQEKNSINFGKLMTNFFFSLHYNSVVICVQINQKFINLRCMYQKVLQKNELIEISLNGTMYDIYS